MPSQGVLVALAIAVGSVALGAILGLFDGAGARAVGPSHTFALVAAITVAASSLLPAALGEIGLIAIGAFLVGLIAPHAIAHAFDHTRGSRAALELSFVGLLLHQLGDGLALGAYVGPAHAGHSHTDVLLAIAAHTVPVAAVVVLTFREQRGRPAAIARAVLLALASVVGIALTELVPHAAVEQAEPWLAAVVAGLLVHVVSHGTPPTAPTRATRLIDLAALAAGVGLAVLGSTSHHGSVALGGPALDIAIAIAPALLIGLLGGAALRASKLGGFGAFAPMCTASGERESHARAIAMSQRAPETLAISLACLGAGAALLRLAISGVIAFIASRAAGPDRRDHIADARGSYPSRFVAELDASVAHQGPLLLVGVVMATYALSALPDDAWATTGVLGLDVAIALLVLVPVHASPVAATPVAMVLVLRGLPPVAAIAALLAGPTIAALLARRALLGGKRTVMAMLVAVLVAVAGAAAIAAVTPTFPALPRSRDPLALACLAGIALLFARSIHREGLRAWLGSLAAVAHVEREGAEGAHAHHGHGNEHGSEHGHAHGETHGSRAEPRHGTRA